MASTDLFFQGSSDDGQITFSGDYTAGTITGVAFGKPITGFSNFNGADNVFYPYGNIRSVTLYTVDVNGLSFTTGSVDYNIRQISQGNTAEEIISSSDPSNPISGSIQGFQSEVFCFATGTKISVADTELPVESLCIGDVVTTASGDVRSVCWIGHRTVDCRQGNFWPVRVSAHAFDTNLPKRDLWLSPGHPVLVGADEDGSGGYLVPIMCLINGTTIERVAVDEITYWHVELDEHDILLAEGLPAESYFDLGSRAWFSGEYGALYDPDLARPGMPGRCRPVAVEGPIVEAERRRLNIIFAARLSSACSWPEKSSLPWTESSYP